MHVSFFRLSRSFMAVALACVFISASEKTGSAQQVFGSIYGTVTDASGAVVGNARITITDREKGTKFEVTTNESGNYTKGQLIPGTYQVQIEAPGFARATSSENPRGG
jgi:hypothetical protein